MTAVSLREKKVLVSKSSSLAVLRISAGAALRLKFGMTEMECFDCFGISATETPTLAQKAREGGAPVRRYEVYLRR